MNDEHQTPFGYFDKSISSNYSFSHLIWVQRSQSFNSLPPPHWLLSASGTEHWPYVIRTCMHICIWICTYSQNLWNGLAYGKKHCWHFKNIHWHFPQREDGKNEKYTENSKPPFFMPIAVLSSPVFNRECTHASSVQYSFSAPDMLNSVGNKVYTVSIQIILR